MLYYYPDQHKQAVTIKTVASQTKSHFWHSKKLLCRKISTALQTDNFGWKIMLENNDVIFVARPLSFEWCLSLFLFHYFFRKTKAAVVIAAIWTISGMIGIPDAVSLR